MLDVRDDRLFQFLSDYKLNLISPAEMVEGEFEKFHTELGYAMRLLKHQSKDANEVILREGHRKVSAETAHFLNAAMKMNLVFVEEPGGVDMCEAMERNNLEKEVTGAIKAFRLDSASDEDIIAKVMRLYDVTKEYVLAIMRSQVA